MERGGGGRRTPHTHISTSALVLGVWLAEVEEEWMREVHADFFVTGPRLSVSPLMGMGGREK